MRGILSGRLGACSEGVPRMLSRRVTLSKGAKLGRWNITEGARQMKRFPRLFKAYVIPWDWRYRSVITTPICADSLTLDYESFLEIPSSFYQITLFDRKLLWCVLFSIKW